MWQFNTKISYLHGCIPSLNDLSGHYLKHEFPPSSFSSLTFLSLVSYTCCEPKDAYTCNNLLILAFWKGWSHSSTLDLQAEKIITVPLTTSLHKVKKIPRFGTREQVVKNPFFKHDSSLKNKSSSTCLAAAACQAVLWKKAATLTEHLLHPLPPPPTKKKERSRVKLPWLLRWFRVVSEMVFSF